MTLKQVSVCATLLVLMIVLAGFLPLGHQQGFAGFNITSAATYTVKGTPGVVHRVVVNKPVNAGTIKLFDIAAAGCTGTPASGAKGVITDPAAVAEPYVLDINTNFDNGICVVTSTTQDVTIVYE